MANLDTFRQLGLSEDIIKALEKKGFESPSKIQEKTIPVFLTDERDIIGQAQTGTGKTAASATGNRMRKIGRAHV